MPLPYTPPPHMSAAELRMYLRALEDACSPRDVCMDEEDEVGTKGCCGEVTYHPHAPDYYTLKLKELIERIKNLKD